MTNSYTHFNCLQLLKTENTKVESKLKAVSVIFVFIYCMCSTYPQVYEEAYMEYSGSVVECLTRDQEAVGSSLTGVTALWSLSKTH